MSDWKIEIDGEVLTLEPEDDNESGARRVLAKWRHRDEISFRFSGGKIGPRKLRIVPPEPEPRITRGEEP